jgi:hypothetical protein
MAHRFVLHRAIFARLLEVQRTQIFVARPRRQPLSWFVGVPGLNQSLRPITIICSIGSECDHLFQWRVQIIPISAARAGGWKTGAAERLRAGSARRLPCRLGQVQLVVAYEAGPLAAEAGLSKQRFGRPDQRMPVEPDDPLALAAPDQHLETIASCAARNRRSFPGFRGATSSKRASGLLWPAAGDLRATLGRAPGVRSPVDARSPA